MLPRGRDDLEDWVDGSEDYPYKRWDKSRRKTKVAF